jgi:two-component system, OmpR family, sensor histidine kinase KdpD
LTLRAGEPRAWLGSLGFVAVSLGIALLLHQLLGLASVAMTFLTAVLVSAVVYGLWPALFASFVSVLAYNFFFLPPLYTFTIADPENVVALFFFGMTGVIASNLTARVRAQAIVARQRARTTEELYQFSRKLAGAANLDDLLWATVHQIALMLKVRVVILLPENGTVAVRAGYPPEDSLDAADLAAAKWCWESNRTAGRGSDTFWDGARGKSMSWHPTRTPGSSLRRFRIGVTWWSGGMAVLWLALALWRTAALRSPQFAVLLFFGLLNLAVVARVVFPGGDRA